MPETIKDTNEEKTSLVEKRNQFSEIQLNVRCAKFAKKWRNSKSEISDKQPYWEALFRAFGRNRKSVAVFELPAKTRLNASGEGNIDLLWPGVLLVEHKSRGKDLEEALVQANGYLDELKGDEIPRYIILCDFFNFVLIDIDQGGKRHEFTIDELPDNTHLLGFMREANVAPIVPDIPVNIKASEIMGKIYDKLRAANYNEEDMEYLLTRLTFCLFAEDAGIFNKKQFSNYIDKSLKNGAQGLGSRLIELFDTLNKPKKDRMTTLDEDLKAFEYINGGLFEHRIDVPSFTVKSSHLLKEATSYDWKDISPVIFGSLFQSVMNAEERRSSGAHYTSEENIMKVLKPLFLDELHEEFNDIISNDVKLQSFHEKLAKLTFFDPACGAGNFLLLAYREIRKLETELLYLLHGDNALLDIDGLSKIDVNQFYGIELNKFSQTIAETAMWMMDHLMNMDLGKKLGDVFVRIPIEQSPHIIHGDALELDWNKILPADKCTYVLGNPPFSGAKIMEPKQKEQLKRIADNRSGFRALDYVTAWFLKGGQYIKNDTPMTFVATNSITQGKQVKPLWDMLSEQGLEIIFAYNSFKWDSESKDKAQVTVVILGLSKISGKQKRLFLTEDNGITELNPKYISPYLGSSNAVLPLVKESSKPINGLPRMRLGTQPIDDGNYIFSVSEKEEFLAKEPGAKPYLRKFINGDDFLNGEYKYLLCLQNAKPAVLKNLPEVCRRMELVKRFRAKGGMSARKLKDFPTVFNNTVLPTKPFLVIPSTTTAKRRYIPIGYLKPPEVASNATTVIETPSLGLFGLLTSMMHVVWVNAIGGKLETRFRYSKSVVYNTFPVPDSNLDALEPYAQKILDVRNTHSESTLADLYDDTTMPQNLRKAHEMLDKAVDKLYRKKPFESNQERLEFLFDKYEKMLLEYNKLKKDSKKTKAKKKPQS